MKYILKYGNVKETFTCFHKAKKRAAKLEEQKQKVTLVKEK